MGWLRFVLIRTILRPLALFLTGADVVDRQRLPFVGPAIIAGNHNSHMDTLLLLSVFPARALKWVRPVAAADYFLKTPALSWFSRNVIGIVPIERVKAGQGVDVLAPAREALEKGAILVIFPEGTRGSNEQEMGPLKSGIARLAAEFPQATVTPVWIQGAGRVLPKGAFLPVPMNCCALVGEAIEWTGDQARFLGALRESLEDLRQKAPPLQWRDPGAAT
ncbi:MAG TPA: lysophospholipid acyltransferase family protein [Caulobacteraceae bacterium]|jgi:1-acyl-sn-glycerol-3-phosphate acyltransferase